MYIYMVKNGFFLNNFKNIDIWILRKERNLFRSEIYMCVPILVKNPRWPPRNFFFIHFNIRPRWFPAHHRDRLVFNTIGKMQNNKQNYEGLYKCCVHDFVIMFYKRLIFLSMCLLSLTEDKMSLSMVQLV